MQRAIVHVDGDGFFASCEIALNPKLKGKPVVTGYERGIATAMSPEAKKLGVHRGMPVFRIRKLFPQVLIVNSHYHIYGMFAQRMYDIVRRYTDRVEEYSIDECFADITGLERKSLTYTDIARSIKQALNTELGMTFSLGLGPTKVIAKVASKWNKPDGFAVIEQMDIQKFLSEMQVGKIWGIGPSSAAQMQRFGIRTALDFIEKPESWVKEHFSLPLIEIWHELRGTPIFKVQSDSEEDPPRVGEQARVEAGQKSVQATRTFGKPTTDKNFLLSELSRNVESATSKIREQKLFAKRIYVFLKTQEFRYHRVEIPLLAPLQSPTQILDEIKRTFDDLYHKETPYRATGVTLSGLVPETTLQNDLFGGVVKNAKKREIFETVDAIDRRYGTHTVTLASSLRANASRGEKPIRRLKIPSMGETL